MNVLHFCDYVQAASLAVGQYESGWRSLLGKMIVGVSTLLFVVVLISGIVIWWPRTRKALKNSLRISVGRGFRRFWYDLHVAGGMYALFFYWLWPLPG